MLSRSDAIPECDRQRDRQTDRQKENVLSVSRVSVLTRNKGHSVERTYLRQRCFDGSVNKTILKARLAAAAGRHYVYVGFSRRKILRSSAYTLSEKAIRFRHPVYPDRAQKLISLSICPDICRHATFHPNPCTRF